MSKFVNYLREINLSGFTLIIPSVSVGNVGQLSVDLLISTYNLSKTATFWHPAIISSVGADPFNDGNSELCVACELYANEQLRVATIQLRSSLEFASALNFFGELRTFIHNCKFEKVLILTSSFAHLLSDPTQTYCYLTNEGTEQALEKLDFRLLKPTVNEKYVVEGSGFGVKLFEILSSLTKCTLLIKYVSEGDNRNDAVNTLNKLQVLLGNLKSDVPLKCPHSWNFIFGNPSPINIF